MTDKASSIRTLLLATCAIAAAGCITGKVLDPATGQGIPGTTVLTYARCTGPSCTVQGEGWQSAGALGTGGDFLYNAYGDSRAYLELPADPTASSCDENPYREAFEVQISAPGFVTRTLFHKPDYKPYIDPETGEEVRDPATGERVVYSSLPRPVYLCPEGAPDTDDDTLCDAIEAKYGTLPTEPDSDWDGLDDAFELFGYGNLDLAAYGAHPLQKDIFVEVDYYPGQTITTDMFDEVVDAFRKAPVDGGRGIALHVVVDDQIPEQHADRDLWIPLWVDWHEFDVMKNCYFEPHRSPAFHYAIFADTLNGGSSGGQSRFIPGHDFVIAVPQVSAREKAATLMHELGHNLGRNHGGPWWDMAEYKPNYLSIMSYLYAYTGVIRGGKWVFDYSRHPIAALNESSLNELTAMDPADESVSEGDLNQYRIVVGGTYRQCLRGAAGSALDFNGPRTYADPQSISPCADQFSGDPEESVQVDLNGNGSPNDAFPASETDWDKLWFWGNGYDGGAIGIQRPGVVQQFAEESVTPEPCPLPPPPAM